MSFLSRIKGGKKRGKQESPVSSGEKVADGTVESVSQQSLSVSPPASPTIASENYAVPVQTSSIFSGLHLSSTVASSEASDSPYMKRSEAGNIVCSVFLQHRLKLSLL